MVRVDGRGMTVIVLWMVLVGDAGRGMTVIVLWIVLVDDAGRCTLEFGVVTGSGTTAIVDVRWIVASVDD